MKILIAPDSFKGSLSAKEVSRILAERAKAYFPESEILSFPIADGGEGTLDCILDARKGERISLLVSDPLGRAVLSEYALLSDGTAVIEMAKASGLPLLTEKERDPVNTSTYGTGELIADALNRGAQNFILTVGGSATNDGGAGALEALGAIFLDQKGSVLHPKGGNLAWIQKIDLSLLHPGLSSAKFTLLCDVDNPLTGENGATKVFGPQKGGTEETLPLLEKGMVHYAQIVGQTLGRDHSRDRGAGAAGGLGFAALAFFDAAFASGIQTILSMTGFLKEVPTADLVLTGEGKIDGQSVFGKVLSGIGSACAPLSVPVIGFTGALGEGWESVYAIGIDALVPISQGPMSLEESICQSERLLSEAADRTFRLLRFKKRR